MIELQTFRGSFYIASNKTDAQVTIKDGKHDITIGTVPVGGQTLFMAISKTIYVDGEVILTLVK